MYRGGLICLDAHFQPLWSKNVPHFGIAHALALGLGLLCFEDSSALISFFRKAPWLAAEVPNLIEKGKISPVKQDE